MIIILCLYLVALWAVFSKFKWRGGAGCRGPFRNYGDQNRITVTPISRPVVKMQSNFFGSASCQRL